MARLSTIVCLTLASLGAGVMQAAAAVVWEAPAGPAVRPSKAKEGHERWYGFRARSEGEVGPRSLARFAAGDRTLLTFEVGERGGVDLVTHLPAPRGHYRGQARFAPAVAHEVVLRVIWSRDPRRGMVEVWYDGDKMIDRLSVATLAPGATPTFTVGPAESVVFTEIREATARADLLRLEAPPVPGKLHPDVPFVRRGPDTLLLDAWVPEGPGPFPTVVIVHGGAFLRGDKRSYVRPLFDVLARAGFAWFSIDYRLAPRNKYPAAVDDVEAALDWVHRQAKRYRVDTGRVALLGESAGGYLVSLVGTRHRRGGKVAAVVPFYTYHEFKLPPAGADGTIPMPRGGALVDFFGIADTGPRAAALLRQAAPIAQVRADMPPFLLYHAKDDQSVPFAQSVMMCEAIVDAGGSCDLFAAERLGHGLGRWKSAPAEHARLVAWLHRKLAPSK